MTTKIIKKKIEAEVDEDLEKYLENSVVAFSILEEELKNGFKEYHKSPKQLDNLLTHYRMQQKDLDSMIERSFRKIKNKRVITHNQMWLGRNILTCTKDRIGKGSFIGEIRKGSELMQTTDEQSDYDFMWTTCTRCKKELWLGIKNGTLITSRCMLCYGKQSDTIKASPCNKGYYKNGSGYYEVLISKKDPYFSMAKKGSNYILEHRYIMAQHLGRCLESWEVVHHINGIKDDNRIENLELLQEPKEHLPSMAMQQRIKKLEKQLSVT